jgi:hypothetical protein
MLHKLTIALTLLLGCAVFLLAADFWETKPFTEWTDKEITKVIEDSPWADKIQVRTGQKGVVAQDDAKGPIMGELEVPVRVIWRTALPVKQALARRQFGPEAATSSDAKALIDRQEQFHVLWLQGLPGNTRAATGNKEELLAQTVLKIKGKTDLHPLDIQISGPPAGGKGRAGAAPQVRFVTAAYQKGGGGGFGGPPPGGGGGPGFGGGTFDLYFLFPKDTPYTVQDKEMEFTTKLEKLTIRKRFKFEDMVFNGKLEM